MADLKINNKTITLQSRIYHIRNITSIGKFKIKPRYSFSIMVILVCFGAAIFCAQVGSSLNRLAAIWASLGGIGILERFLRKTKYGISLKTNAASTALIASKDEKFIDEIIEKMHQVLEDQDTPVSYTFNVAEGDIFDMRDGKFETGVNILH